MSEWKSRDMYDLSCWTPGFRCQRANSSGISMLIEISNEPMFGRKRPVIKFILRSCREQESVSRRDCDSGGGTHTLIVVRVFCQKEEQAAVGVYLP